MSRYLNNSLFRLLTCLQLVFILSGYLFEVGAQSSSAEILESPSEVSSSDSLPRIPRRGTITPVDIDREKPRGPVLHYYDSHGNLLDEPVLFLTETDTVAKTSASSPYHLFDGINVGINFIDAVMLIAGQDYASFDIWASVSLHNWIFPVLEAGIGYGKTQPEGGNFCYKAKPSPYFKLGANYNFLYKSNPDYQAFIGLRGGFSSYRWDVTDIKISDGYWHQYPEYNILNQSASTLYGEALGGLQVKLFKGLSMGWTLRYRFKFHTSRKVNPGSPQPGSDPWFIPGYGTNNSLGFTFSLIYHIPGRPRKLSPPENK
ncbi:MAG: DUF6048 family protein [Clostridium sp.]|nr:DUF6048 family protein [Prevotella sp.]MCM1378113.1 DUF6048 family protein [Prevotella sp.]MCM1428953.1 DUF6048 family protein [Clostridium sp.]